MEMLSYRAYSDQIPLTGPSLLQCATCYTLFKSCWLLCQHCQYEHKIQIYTATTELVKENPRNLNEASTIQAKPQIISSPHKTLDIQPLEHQSSHIYQEHKDSSHVDTQGDVGVISPCGDTTRSFVKNERISEDDADNTEYNTNFNIDNHGIREATANHKESDNTLNVSGIVSDEPKDLGMATISSDDEEDTPVTYYQGKSLYKVGKDGRYICDLCNRTFSQTSSLNRHLKHGRCGRPQGRPPGYPPCRPPCCPRGRQPKKKGVKFHIQTSMSLCNKKSTNGCDRAFSQESAVNKHNDIAGKNLQSMTLSINLGKKVDNTASKHYSNQIKISADKNLRVDGCHPSNEDVLSSRESAHIKDDNRDSITQLSHVNLDKSTAEVTEDKVIQKKRKVLWKSSPKYSCNLCGRQFSQPSSLGRHKKFKRCGRWAGQCKGQQLNKGRILLPISPPVTKHINMKACKVRNKTFVQESSLLKPEECGPCSRLSDQNKNISSEDNSTSGYGGDTSKEVIDYENADEATTPYNAGVACSQVENETVSTTDQEGKPEATQCTGKKASKVSYETSVSPSSEGFICNLCGKIFSKKAALNRHMRHTHISHIKKNDNNDEDHYVCEKCGAILNNKKEFMAHVTKHKNQCPVCHLYCHVPHALKDHMNKHTGHKPYICEHCAMPFSVMSYLRTHLKKMHNSRDNVVCQLCDMVFVSQKKLRVHGRKIHKVKEKLTCDTCGRLFLLKRLLKYHLISHSAERNFSCAICGKRFKTKPSLTAHERIHSGEKPYHCQYCNKSFVQLGQLQIHEKRHTNDRHFKCDQCHKAFVSKYHCMVHMRIHSGFKPFKCSFCSKSFSDQSNLIQHKRQHTGQMPHKCLICHKGFCRRKKLTIHSQTCH